MSIAPTVGTPSKKFSLPVVAYYYEFTGLTNDGTTKNTCVCGGLPVGFTPNGALVGVKAQSTTGSVTPQAAYAVYDNDTLALDGSDPTKVNIDIYTKDITTGGGSINWVLLY